MYHARVENNTVVQVLQVDPATIFSDHYASLFVPCPEDVEIGWLSDGQAFAPPPPPPPPPPGPAEWFIDVGAFFDRFDGAKMPLLMSANATVQALVKDIQVRKWIDLQRADVGQGIDALIALAVPGIDAALKIAILTTPVTPEENFALRKVYFS